MNPTEPVLVSIRRTAIGRANGVFRDCDVATLGAPVVQATLAEAGLAVGDVDEAHLGNALEGGNVARRVALSGGLPPDVPAFTLDRQCASGLDTIVDGFVRVASGQVGAILVGGAESVSTAPRRTPSTASDTLAIKTSERAPFSAYPYTDPDPVAAADSLAARYGVGREAQDARAEQSHRNAVEAEQAGHFDAERVVVRGGSKLEPDQIPRDDLDQSRLKRLPPLRPGGTATVANTASEADGAVVGLIVTRQRAQRLGIRHALRLDGHAFSGCDPGEAGYAAVGALTRLADNQPLAGFDRVEFNEAFAGQTLVCLQAAGLAPERVCTRGGALAFGHPFGASGALLACRLFHDLPPGQRGLAVLSAMGGQGTAVAFTAIDPVCEAGVGSGHCGMP